MMNWFAMRTFVSFVLQLIVGKERHNSRVVVRCTSPESFVIIAAEARRRKRRS